MLSTVVQLGKEQTLARGAVRFLSCDEKGCPGMLRDAMSEARYTR